jgi:alkyldihydroxyacetonephosphate synthase
MIRISPKEPPKKSNSQEQENLSKWGYQDSCFQINSHGDLEMIGSRYVMSGETFPGFFPWVQKIFEIGSIPSETHNTAYPPEIPPPLINQSFLESLKDFLQSDQVTLDPKIRLRHGHGHALEEIYAINYKSMNRVPDIVIYPQTEEEISQIVKFALEFNICLIPYGGGTNVSKSLSCVLKEQRMIASIDLQKMNRILWIDPDDNLACIQAGAIGSDIADKLSEHRLTMGHEPDSIEFSTLGGWIATYASGMKKNKYGNIEDIVIEVSMVTANGTINRRSIAPRESVGINPKFFILGSEGNLGIITQAVVKVFPLPELQYFNSILFSDFENGFKFLNELTKKNLQPASVRLFDNLQFQFSRALKPCSSNFHQGIKAWLEKFYVMKIRHFDPNEMVGCTLLFEGMKKQVRDQEKTLLKLARKFGGITTGENNGKRGYQSTFCIAYLRDLLLQHFILAESFETSVRWSQAISLIKNVKELIYSECKRFNIPGRPFISCRISQTYQTGVCIYFYFAFYHKGLSNPIETYNTIESKSREIIIKSGGSFSHHHGIGKIRQKLLNENLSQSEATHQRAIKRSFDPQNIFGSSNNFMDIH